MSDQTPPPESLLPYDRWTEEAMRNVALRALEFREHFHGPGEGPHVRGFGPVLRGTARMCRGHRRHPFILCNFLALDSMCVCCHYFSVRNIVSFYEMK